MRAIHSSAHHICWKANEHRNKDLPPYPYVDLIRVNVREAVSCIASSLFVSSFRLVGSLDLSTHERVVPRNVVDIRNIMPTCRASACYFMTVESLHLPLRHLDSHITSRLMPNLVNHGIASMIGPSIGKFVSCCSSFPSSLAIVGCTKGGSLVRSFALWQIYSELGQINTSKCRANVKERGRTSMSQALPYIKQLISERRWRKCSLI